MNSGMMFLCTISTRDGRKKKNFHAVHTEKKGISHLATTGDQNEQQKPDHFITPNEININI